MATLQAPAAPRKSRISWRQRHQQQEQEETELQEQLQQGKMQQPEQESRRQRHQQQQLMLQQHPQNGRFNHQPQLQNNLQHAQNVQQQLQNRPQHAQNMAQQQQQNRPQRRRHNNLQQRLLNNAGGRNVAPIRQQNLGDVQRPNHWRNHPDLCSPSHLVHIARPSHRMLNTATTRRRLFIMGGDQTVIHRLHKKRMKELLSHLKHEERQHQQGLPICRKRLYT